MRAGTILGNMCRTNLRWIASLFFRSSLLSLGDAERRHSQLDSGMDARGSGISVPLARSPGAQKGSKTKKALDATAWMQEAGPAQHLYAIYTSVALSTTGVLKNSQLDNAKALTGVCEKKKSRSCCAHFDVGARSPTPQFQCCYLCKDLAYKNRLFFSHRLCTREAQANQH